MPDLGELLKLELAESSPLAGQSGLSNVIRPAPSGLKWVSVPSLAVGLAFRLDNGGQALETLSISEDLEVTVQSVVDIGIPGVHIASSHDGRVVAVACMDGSLQCYNATSSGLSLRWRLDNVHSHVVSDLSESPSTSRMCAAGASGPVRTMAFSPDGYTLMLVNDDVTRQNQCLQLYNAAEFFPLDLVAQQPQNQQILANIAVTSASWASTASARDTFSLAVGSSCGSLHVFQHNTATAILSSLSILPFPGEEDDAEGYSCTHLDWSAPSNSLVAGFCRVIPSSDDDDEDDEDDSAEHETRMFASEMEPKTGQLRTEWSELGDVVPFFSVPKHGRHVFFTTPCAIKNNESSLVAVASNVGSDISILASDDSGNWAIVDIPDGSNPTTPTDDDDEYMFPLGLAVVKVPNTRPGLLVAATDGSLSAFRFMHEEDPDFFMIPTGGISVLPDTPVDAEYPAAEPPELENELPVEDEAPPASPVAHSASAPSHPFGFGGGPRAENTFELTTTTFGGGALFVGSAPPFGVSGSTSFGNTSGAPLAAGTATPSLGSGGSYAFGTTGSTFGSPSPASAPAPAPTFGGMPGGAVFGSGAASGGGFAALAKSGNSAGVESAFGVLASSTPGTDEPFGAFSKRTSTRSSIFGGKTASAGATTKEDGSPVAKSEPAATGSSNKAAVGGVSFEIKAAEPNSCKPSSKDTSAPATSGSSFGSSPAFGQGSLIPSFPTHAFAASKPRVSAVDTSASPFNLFGAKADVSSHASEMVKPLFGALQATGLAPAKSDDKADPHSPEEASLKSQLHSSTSSPPKAENPAVEEAATLGGPMAKKGAHVFDSFDSEKSGVLPSSMFEDLQDELGEGFHGEEMEKQLQLIDPQGSGLLHRAAFVDWYVTLVESGGDDRGDDGSLDSEERAERAEEREKAQEAFLSFSSKEGDNDVIDSSSFKDVIESMGTTYCEEEHHKTITKLQKSSGKIHLGDFLSWYEDWLFGDNEEEDLAEEDSYVNVEGVGSGEASGWGDKFRVDDQNTWQCQVCSVRNTNSANACAACETARPGSGDITTSSGATTSNKVEKETSVATGIGAGGFSFGAGKDVAAGSGIGASGFTFGGGSITKTTSDNAVEAKKTSGGLTFGGVTKSGLLSGASGSTSEGFSFRSPAPTVGASFPVSSSGSGIGTGGFTFWGVASVGSSSPPKSHGGFSFSQSASGIQERSEESGNKTQATSGEKSTHAASPSRTPSLSFSEAVTGTTQEGTIAKKGAHVFDSFDNEKSGVLPASMFEDLQDELGEGFHGEEMEKQLQLIDPQGSGLLHRAAFVDWYVTLVESGGDDRGDDGSLDSEERAERAEEREKAQEAFLSFASKEGDNDVIDSSSFKDVIESMGTTYCEEEHHKTITKLQKSSWKIHLGDFLSWYEDWLFGDNEEEDLAEEDSYVNVEGVGSSEASGWGDKFRVDDQNTWQCQVCSVRNTNSANVCAACETARSGSGDITTSSGATTSNKVEKETSVAAGIGAGGFSFGAGKDVAAGSGIGASGFTFGGGSITKTTSDTADEAKKTSGDLTSGGLTFDGATNSGLSSGAFGSTSEGFSFRSPAPTVGASVQPPSGASILPSLSYMDSDTGSKTPGFSFRAQVSKVQKSPTTADKSSTEEKDPLVGASTTTSYPPVVSVPPKPFSEPVASKPTSSTSSAYPPMASAAPKPFSAPALAKPTNSAISAYPPTASKAPIPFGSPPALAKPASSASSAFPPMASKAPVPFGALPTPAKPTSAASSAYPPMASKAPIPFGSRPALAKPASSASSAFPPMASKAPVLFGALPAPSKPTSAASSAYPPMASKAPIPFGSPPNSTKPTSSASSAFPPMASKAPVPFGAPPAPAKAASSAYPPMASKAPIPFGSRAPLKPTSSASSATLAFPTVAFTAPTPFGSPAPAMPTGSSTAASAALLPMASTTPIPFGSTAPTMSVGAPSPFNLASKTGQSLMPSASPSPFGVPGAANGSATTSLSPFGAFSGAKSPFGPDAEGNTKAPAAFPPLAAKAPKPFGTERYKETSIGAKDAAKQIPPSADRSLPSKSGQSSKPVPGPAKISRENMTECEYQFATFSETLNRTLEKIVRSRPDATDPLQGDIESIVTEIQRLRVICLENDQMVSKFACHRAFLLSRKADASRQAAEAQSILNEIESDQGAGEPDVMLTQPLDRDSEERRRQLATESVAVHRLLNILEARIKLVNKLCSSDEKHASNELLRSVIHSFEKAKLFEQEVDRLQRKIVNVGKSLPVPSVTTQPLLSPPTGTGRFRRRLKITPLPWPSQIDPRSRQTSSAGRGESNEKAVKWKNVESNLKMFENRGVKNVDVRCPVSSTPKIPRSRGLIAQPSLMLPASKPSYDLVPAKRQEAPSNVFSPPSSLKSRAGWDVVSNVDMARARQVSMEFPSEVKELSFESASRDALSAFGTTPEKVRESISVTKRSSSSFADRTQPPVPKESSIDESNSGGGQIKKGQSAAFPPLPTKAPTPVSKKLSGNGGSSPKKADPASFPPLPKSAPTPFASASNPKSQAPLSAKDALPPSSFSLKDALPGFSTKDAAPSNPRTVADTVDVADDLLSDEKSSISPFGSMKGLGDSLFSSRLGSPAPPKASGSSVAPSGASSEPDYTAVLRAFYEKYNPDKVGSVDNHLMNFKGREPEMFKKLAAKYNAPNPLDNKKSAAAPASTMSTNSPGLGSRSPFSAPAPKFGQQNVLSQSAFSGSSQQSNQSHTPFSSTGQQTNQSQTSFSSSGQQAAGSQAQSPFSSAGLQPNLSTKSPFTSQTPPTPSPFGPTIGKSPGFFGSTPAFGSTPTPFGSASSAAPSTAGFGGGMEATPAGGQQSFAGKSPREMLTAFYQHTNPSKLAEVEKVLSKYKGNEEQMFRNLAKKYNLNPSVFGLAATPAGSSFGSPAPASVGFGQASVLGGGPPLGGGPSPFGGGGFGQSSPLVQSMAGSRTPASASTFGSSAPVFGAASFGALAQASSPSPFGGASQGGFGGGLSSFGGSPPFGTATPFGAPRR